MMRTIHTQGRLTDSGWSSTTRAAGEIATLANGFDYSAVVFLEANVDTYTVEEQTPWGVGLSLNKPVHGLSTRSTDATVQLCAATAAPGNALMVVDQVVPPAALETVARSCRLTLQHLDRWRSNERVLTQKKEPADAGRKRG